MSVKLEELSEVLSREVPLYVLLLVHHAAAQSLLVSLALKHLLLDSSSLAKRWGISEEDRTDRHVENGGRNGKETDI